MKRRFDYFTWVSAIACVACFATAAYAQGLWKYTDKNGKVTYSDKAPKEGEKAEPVIAVTTGTVVPASKNVYDGKQQRSATISSRAAEREAERDNFRRKVDVAREELEQARKALESGQEPTPEERQIVVGRGKDGQSTGVNAVLRKPEFYERIAKLEAAVKKAEASVEAAERDFRDKAPK